MDCMTRFYRAVGVLLWLSGTLCFGWGAGIFFALGIGSLMFCFRGFPQFRGFPEWFVRPILTLFALGFLAFLPFCGNLPHYTGLPRLSYEDAFWLFNFCLLLLEVFLLLSRRMTVTRNFLLLIAAEQLISGLLFRPGIVSFLFFIPAFALLLYAVHLLAEFSQMKQSLLHETGAACDELTRIFSVSSSGNSRRTPVELGISGEIEIRERLDRYPIRVERKRQALRFVQEVESLERVSCWEDGVLPHRGPVAGWMLSFLIFGFLFFAGFYRPAHFTAGYFGWSVPSAIGYSETSRLGEFGPQLGNPRPFLWLRLFRDDGTLTWKQTVGPQEFSQDPAVPGNLSESFYLRGAVFGRYRKAGWEPAESSGVNPTCPRTLRFSQSQLHLHRNAWRQPDLIRIEETFEPTTESAFFAVWPFLLPPGTHDAPSRFDPFREKVLFANGEPIPGKSYSLLTHGFHQESNFMENGTANAIPRLAQSPWTPAMTPELDAAFSEMPSLEVFPSLCGLAQKWAAEFENSEDQDGSAAFSSRKLAQHFASRLAFSPEFSYSTAPVRRERELDPLEDFIRNHPQGHCEFYAAALVQMLRSQGIPARYVVGFAVQEYSSTAKAWVVRHQDAHAWVEAWIPRHEIPEEVFAQSSVPETYWRYGAWLRLDPVSHHLVPVREASQTFLFSLFDVCETFWKNSILNLNFQTQQERIYAPVFQWLRDLGGTLLALPKNISAWFSELSADSVSGGKRRFFHELYALLMLGTLPVGILLWMGISRLLRWWKEQEHRAENCRSGECRAGQQRDGKESENDWGMMAEEWNSLERLKKRREHSVVSFRSLEAEIEALGRKRRTGETSLEFMNEAAKLFQRPELPEETRKYYALRFGGMRELQRNEQ